MSNGWPEPEKYKPLIEIRESDKERSQRERKVWTEGLRDLF